MQTKNTIGQWEDVLERAAAFGNRHNGIESARRFIQRCHWSEFGIESATVADTSFQYINQGDTYVPTIVEIDGECLVSTFGGQVETIENSFCDENDSIRCGNCGAFTPKWRFAEWHDTICESCNRNVSDGSKPAPIPVDSIEIPAQFLETARDWAGGMDCPLRAIESTGGLTLGSIRPLNDDGEQMSDEEWYHTLWFDLDCTLSHLVKSANGRADLAEEVERLREFQEFAETIADRLARSYGFDC